MRLTFEQLAQTATKKRVIIRYYDTGLNHPGPGQHILPDCIGTSGVFLEPSLKFGQREASISTKAASLYVSPYRFVLQLFPESDEA